MIYAAVAESLDYARDFMQLGNLIVLGVANCIERSRDAAVAELADARDLKSLGRIDCAGSSPARGKLNDQSLFSKTTRETPSILAAFSLSDPAAAKTS